MNAASEIIDHVTCPFCGLACDDLRVQRGAQRWSVIANGCSISRAAFERIAAAPASAVARVRGTALAFDGAVRAAAEILRAARQPVIAGLATDVAGMRAVMQLAQACGAVTDHMNARAKLRNVLAYQTGPWITTTFAEVKNRADLLLVIGTDIVSRFPRFFERLVWNRESMFGVSPSQRQVIYLGDVKDTSAGIAPDGRKPGVIRCSSDALGEVLGALRLLASKDAALIALPASRTDIAGIELRALRALAEKLNSATYGVVVWAAADLDIAHGELVVQRIAELVAALNATTRCAGLPLGGSDGDITAGQAHVWQSGFPFRTSFAQGVAHYDPFHNGVEQMLARGEADALLWISSWNETRAPPPTDVPTIVLGRADMNLAREPAVFIPVGTPGVDHAGHFFRSDKVVTMRLGKLRETDRPSVADVVAEIEEAYVDQP